MFVATLVVSIAFAALLAVSAAGKLKRDPQQMKTLERVGATRLRPLLAFLELAGAAGLLVGLAWWPLGVAAGIGLVLYFAGAIAAHLRVGDRAVLPPALLLVVSLAATALRLASAVS
ncbi:DoxX family protein [Micromonospora musae]|uniref:DoxX family protein n=1 Tax=Micromonospora musae TaxID=1894970 RepID=A0A3A9YI78_9ACTN|nr:DoxX family protein [Micromonospora musae]RKN21238.1 DoxX family protein [Micromonospora musae]RKN36423.1 DoxX family protein [Micromonospora musae]